MITEGVSTEVKRLHFHLVLSLRKSGSLSPVAHVFISCTRTLFHTWSHNLFMLSFFSLGITKAADMHDGDWRRNSIHFGALKHWM